MWPVGHYFRYSCNYHGFHVKSDHLVQKGRIIIYIEMSANVGIVERFEASFTDLKVGGSNPANDCIRL